MGTLLAAARCCALLCVAVSGDSCAVRCRTLRFEALLRVFPLRIFIGTKNMADNDDDDDDDVLLLTATDCVLRLRLIIIIIMMIIRFVKRQNVAGKSVNVGYIQLQLIMSDSEITVILFWNCALTKFYFTDSSGCLFRSLMRSCLLLDQVSSWEILDGAAALILGSSWLYVSL